MGYKKPARPLQHLSVPGGSCSHRRRWVFVISSDGRVWCRLSQSSAATRPDPALGSCREGGQDHASVWSRDRLAPTGLSLALVKSLTDTLVPFQKGFQSEAVPVSITGPPCAIVYTHSAHLSTPLDLPDGRSINAEKGYGVESVGEIHPTIGGRRHRPDR